MSWKTREKEEEKEKKKIHPMHAFQGQGWL
jgi:hypothetical protein